MKEQDLTGQTLITVNHLTKSYTRAAEKLEVLHDVSVTVQSGEFVALMGPSGSGKTTLLNIVAGLDAPDSGEVIVAGEKIATFSEDQLADWRAQNVGFIFQFYNLLPVLTALENVSLPLSLLPMSKQEREERARFALEVVGLADRHKHFPAQLSGGQEQRVAIARAIVSDPKILVADEPTGDLDRSTATDILELLRKLNQEYKKTILMVTHDPAAAEYASRRLHLDKGRVVD